MNESGKKPGIKKRYFLLVPLFLILGLVVGSWIFLQSDSGRSFVKSQIKSALKTSINGDLEFEVESGSILGSVTLKDVSLWTKDRDFVASAPEIRASYNPLGFFDGQISIDSIETKNLIFVAETKDEKSTLSGLFLSDENPKPSANLQIDLSKISLEESFFVSFSSTEKSSPFVRKEKISVKTLREMQNEAKGPGKLEGSVGPVILGDITANLIVNIDTNGGTNISIGKLVSKLSIDKFMTVQELKADPILLSFFDGNMGIKTGVLSVGKKLSTTKIRFHGHFPDADSEEWFDKHELNIDELILSRGYLRALSEFQLNPKRDPIIAFQSQGSLPNRIQYTTSIKVAETRFESTGIIEQLLNEKNIGIDAIIDVPNFRIEDLLPVDRKIQGAAKVKIKGEFSKPAELNISGFVTDFDVEDYHFEEALFSARLSNGNLDIEQFRLKWGDLRGNVSGQISNDGPFRLNLQAKTNPIKTEPTQADVKIAASGSINWEAAEALQFLNTLEAEGGWNLNAFKRGPLKVKRSRGNFDIDLTNATNCKSKKPSATCYPKELDLRVRASGSDLRLKRDFLSRYNVDIDMAAKVGRDIDIEALLSSLSGTFKADIGSAKFDDIRILNTKAKGSVKALSADKFNYDADISSGLLKIEGQEVQNLKAKASGRIQTNKARTRITSATSSGKLSVDEFKDEANKVRKLKAKFSVKKRGQKFLGDIDFTADESTLADRSFSGLDGKVELKDDSIFDLSVTGAAPKKSKEKKDTTIRAKGSYRNGVRLDELNFGDDGYVVKNSLEIQDDHFVFNDVRISRKSQEVKIDGDFRKGESQNLKVALKEIQLADLSQELGIEILEPYKGEVNGEFEVSGTAAKPTSIFDISIRDFYVGQFGPIDARIKGRYDDDALSISTIKIDFFKEVTLLGEASLPVSITQDASPKWNFSGPISSTQKILKFDCGRLVDQFTKNKDLEISGEAGATFELSGTLNAPVVNTKWTFENLGASGFIAKTAVDLGPFNGTLSANHRPQRTGAKFNSSLKLDSELGRLIFTASSREQIPKMVRAFLAESVLPEFRDLNFDMGIRTQNFKIQNLQLGPLVDANAEGQLNLAADFRGSINKPDIGGKITLNGFGWNRFRDFEFYTAFNLNPKALTLGGTRLGWDGSQVLTADANIPNPINLVSDDRKLDESPFDVSINFVPFALKKLSTFDYKFASLSGTLEGNILARGSFRELKFRSRIEISDVLFGDGKKGKANMNVSLEDDRLSMDAAVLRSGDNATMDISVPFTQNFSDALSSGEWSKTGEISGHINAKNTPLAGLMPSSLYKDHLENLKGNVFSNITIAGTTARPNVNGRLEIEKAAFTLRDYGRRFEDVGLMVDLEKNRINIKTIQAKDGTGSVNGEGFAVIEDWKIKNINGDFRAKRFSIEGFSSTPAFVSAKAKVSGDFSTESATTAVDISGLKIVLPDNQSTGALPTNLDEDLIIIENDSEELSDFSRSKASVVDRIYAKMKVDIADGEIIHPIGNVEFLGELDIDLANIGALINGDLRTTQGKVEIFGKVFEVQPGLVSFRGLDPPNPYLDIEAHYKLSRQIIEVVGEASSGEARAIVRITGPANDPQEQFSADPQMSEADVRYILITNRAPGSAGVGEAEAGLAFGAASTGLTGIASMIVGSANKVLPDIAKVDVIRVEAGQNQGKVEVGKYLSRKLFVLYRYRFGAEEGESQHEVTFEYRFLPEWILDFQVGDADQGEFNLLWDIY